MLVGRDAESATISSFLDSLTHGPGVLLIEGVTGAGKTSLLSQALGNAVLLGHKVLSATPDKFEAPLAFAGLTDLLEWVPAGMVTRLPHPQRLAVSELTLRAKPRRAAPDLRAAGTAVLTLLRSLARKAPVLLVIDNLQWLDSASVGALRFALRRLRTEPVGLLAAARTDWSGGLPSLATDSIPVERVDHLRLGPLSLPAIRELVTAGTEMPPSRASLAWLHKTCGGNPLFAMELAKHSAADILARLPDTTRVPDLLRQLVLGLTATLSPGSHDVLLISSLSTELTSAVICAAARDPATAFTDLEIGIDAGILTAAGGKVVFVHPLLRFAVAAQARADDRRAAHRRLAAVVIDPEARMRHRAMGTAGPDETMAADLEAAALAAADRGARAISGELAELSVALTPVTQAQDRQRRTVLAAEQCFQTSDQVRACSMLADAIDTVPCGPARAELRRRLSHYRAFCGEPVEGRLAALGHALAEAGDDARLRAEILTDQAICASFTRHRRPANYDGLLADGTGDNALQARCCAGVAFSAFVLGDGLKPDMVSRAIAGPPQRLRLTMELRPGVAIGHVLHWTDDLDGARALYERECDLVAAQGAEAELPFILWALAENEGWAGNWRRAEQLGAEGYRLAEDYGSPLAIAFMSVACGLMHAYRGRADASLRDATQAIDLAGQLGMPLLALMAAQCFGITALPTGDVMAGHQRLAPFAGAVSGVRAAEPALCRFLPDEIEALTRLGELGMAEDLLRPFEDRSSELGRGWANAAAFRCRGLLLAAHGDLGGAESSLDTALEMHQRLSMPFERARTLLAAGEVHRRARRKRKALGFLRDALAVFERLGAPLWENRSRDELTRIGIRSAALGGGAEDREHGPTASARKDGPTAAAREHGLTAAERRVAGLAAMGRTNVQIAAELFMGRRTVEAHLSRIYQKFGVRSRTELCRMLLSPPQLALANGRGSREHAEITDSSELGARLP